MVDEPEKKRLFWVFEKEFQTSDPEDSNWLRCTTARLLKTTDVGDFDVVDASTAASVRELWVARKNPEGGKNDPSPPGTSGQEPTRSVRNDSNPPEIEPGRPDSTTREEDGLERPKVAHSGIHILRESRESRETWKPKKRIVQDQSISSATVIATSILMTFASMLGWNQMPAAAEWLVTMGAHAYTLPVIGFLGTLSLLPDLRPRNLARSMSWGRLAFATIRGLAIGTVLIIVLPYQGDLWNRSHEMAFVLVIAMTIGLFRPWDIAAVPLRIVLGGVIRQPLLPLSRRVVRHIADYQMKALGKFESTPAAELSLMQRIRRVRLGTAPPQWFLLALEIRLARLANLLTRADAPDERRRREFEEMALLELQLACFLPKADLDRVLPACKDRVAECLTLTLRSSRLDGDDGVANRMNPLIEALWRLGERSSSASCKGLRMLKAARQAQSIQPKNTIVRIAFESKLDRLSSEDLSFAIIALAYLALRMNEERLFGWSEGLARRLETLAGTALRLNGPDHHLILATKSLALASQIPLEHIELETSEDPDLDRILAETQACIGQVGARGLGRSIPGTPTPHARHRMKKIAVPIETHAFLLRHERNGLHGMLPSGLWIQGLVLFLMFVAIGAVCNIDEHTRFASSVVQITDPFRSGATRPGQMRVSSAAIDAQSANVVLGTPDGAHVFNPRVFRHSTETVGPGGPSGPIQDLAPIRDGGVLARVGESGAGIDLRNPDGDWKTLIKIPPSSLGSRDILDVLRESTTTLLILTAEDILRYHEPERALEAVSVNPPLPDDCIGWAMAGNEILVLRDFELVKLTSHEDGFNARSISMPAALGKPTELYSAETSFLVRTSKDALISLVSNDQWRVIAGGRQFEESPAIIRSVVANPGSDSILLTTADNGRHGVRVRPAGIRYWKEGYLPSGITHGDILPLLDPAGNQSLVVDDDGGLWLASATPSDPLALELSRLAPKATVESMSTIPGGFTLVLRTPVGIELRTGDWGAIGGLGERIRTVRPIEIEGGIVAAIPDPSTPSRMLIVDREGGVIEYDRTRRSMIGDRLQLLLPNGEPSRRPQSATFSKTELIVVSEDGEVCSYPDPNMIKPGQPAGVLSCLATILPRFAARPDTKIESLRDTRVGFELVDAAGDAWEYELQNGWRTTSEKISDRIDPTTLRRLDGGTIIALSGKGNVLWRGDEEWLKSDIQLDEVMPCTNGISGIDSNGRTIVVRATRNGRPSPEVVFEPQDFARLEFPLHDAVTVGKSGDLWIAHQGGLSVYHPSDGGSWSRCAVGDESFVRVETGGEYIFAESDGGDLWGVAPQTQRGVLLVPECDSWTPCGEGRILALRSDHGLQMLDGLRAKTIIRSDSGLVSTDPVSATCSAEAAWILESERLYKVTGEGEVEVIPLPAVNARAIAANSDTLHILIGSKIYAYSPASGDWLPSVIDDADQIVELPGLVVGIGNDRSLMLLGNDNRATDVLPGAVATRAHPLADTGWMLEDDRGLWINSKDGLLRWLPMGDGGFLPANAEGATIQKVGSRTFHLRSDEVVELTDTPVGPHSSLIADHRADQVLEFSDTLALVTDNTLRRTTSVQGSTVRFCFGKPSDDSKRIADLVQGPSGEAVLLSDRGRLLRYDAKTRRFMRENESGIKSQFARLHSLDSSTWLVSDGDSGTLEILRTNAGVAPSQLNEVRSWGILNSQVIAITDSGSLQRGSSAGWDTVKSAPARRADTAISSHAPLGLQSMIVLSQRGEIFLRSNDRTGVTPITDADHDFQSIRSLSDGRVISRRRAPRGEASEILIIDEQRNLRRPGSFMLVEGPVDPQLLDANQRVLSSVNGAALWNLEDARLNLQKIELLKDANDGKRAFVLDSEGALGEITLDRIGSRVLSMFDPEKAESLALSLVGEPVVITKDSIDRVNKPRLLLAQNTTAVPLDRGVAWLDDLRRLRVDELSFDHLIPGAEDMSDRIDINLDIAQRFTAGDTEIVGDGKRHWRFRPASRSLEEIRLVPKNGMTLYAAETSSRILLNDARGTFHFLGEGRDAEMDPPPGIGGEVVPFQRWITSIDKNTFYALDLDQPAPDWIAIPLDPTLPPNIIAAFPLRKSNTCLGVGSGGSVWQRTEFRTWKQIADEGTLPDLTDAGLELREPGGSADLEFVISSRVDGEIRSAWIFSNDQLIARMRQEEALVIAPVGQPPPGD
ncbi:hypothetical protein OAG62_00535 [bacterium]|nr:hypothetical protein [bacterium]